MAYRKKELIKNDSNVDTTNRGIIDPLVLDLQEDTEAFKGFAVHTVKDFYDNSVEVPQSPSGGDIWIAGATNDGWTKNHIYTWVTPSWVETVPDDGDKATLTEPNPDEEWICLGNNVGAGVDNWYEIEPGHHHSTNWNISTVEPVEWKYPAVAGDKVRPNSLRLTPYFCDKNIRHCGQGTIAFLGSSVGGPAINDRSIPYSWGSTDGVTAEPDTLLGSTLIPMPQLQKQFKIKKVINDLTDTIFDTVTTYWSMGIEAWIILSSNTVNKSTSIIELGTIKLDFILPAKGNLDGVHAAMLYGHSDNETALSYSLDINLNSIYDDVNGDDYSMQNTWVKRVRLQPSMFDMSLLYSELKYSQMYYTGASTMRVNAYITSLVSGTIGWGPLGITIFLNNEYIGLDDSFSREIIRT